MAKNSGNEPNFNPYAPPLCDLVVDPSHFQSEAIDPQIIELLNELQRSPIVVSSHVEEYVNSAIGPASTRKVGEDAGVLYGLVLLLLIALLLVPATRIVGVLLLLFLAAAQIFPRGKWQNPRYKTCVSPAGVYVWLITEGGVLITTPSNAQWGIPWSHIAKITSIPAGWCLETCADSRNTWHMPVTGIRSDDSALFLQIAQFIRQLNQESRPHPILSAQSAVWSDQRTRFIGKNWTVLHEGARTWCEFQGLVCDLPNSQATTTEKSLLVEDYETGWTCYLSHNGQNS